MLRKTLARLPLIEARGDNYKSYENSDYFILLIGIFLLIKTLVAVILYGRS